MIPCESCEELKKEVERLNLKMQATRKWKIAGAPLTEFLRLAGSVFLRLVDKFALLNSPEKSNEDIAALAVELTNALYDALYKANREDD